MKTKDKIVLASLELFNAQGERNVTTNHIAAHLGISPGNLYYHFRNKSEIIYAIFKNYELLVETYLVLPESINTDEEALIQYLESTVNGLWAYRFLHRDLEHLLESDERLRADYREFTLRCLAAIQRISVFMEGAGVYCPMSDTQRQSMSLNIWLIVTNWMTYLKMTQNDDVLEIEAIGHGVYQILDYLLPYLAEDKVERMTALQQAYRYESVMPDLTNYL